MTWVMKSVVLDVAPLPCSSVSRVMPHCWAMPNHDSPDSTTYGRQPLRQHDGSPTGTRNTAPGVSDVDEMPCRAIRAMDVTYWREMLNSVCPA